MQYNRVPLVEFELGVLNIHVELIISPFEFAKPVLVFLDLLVQIGDRLLVTVFLDKAEQSQDIVTVVFSNYYYFLYIFFFFREPLYRIRELITKKAMELESTGVKIILMQEAMKSKVFTWGYKMYRSKHLCISYLPLLGVPQFNVLFFKLLLLVFGFFDLLLQIFHLL